MEKNIILLLFSLVGGVLWDYLFYDKTAGVSVPIAVVLFYMVLLWRLKNEDSFDFRFSSVRKGEDHGGINFAGFLCLPIILLSLTYVLYSSHLFHGLNMVALPLLITVQLVLLTEKHTYPWHNIRFIPEVLRQMIPHSLRYFPVPYQMVTARIRSRVKELQYKTMTKVLWGLLISLPVVLIVTSLLVSADKVFEEAVYKLPNLFEGMQLGEMVFRGVLILFIATYIFSYIWSLLRPKRDGNKVAVETERWKFGKLEEGQEYEHHPRSFDSIIALTLLVAINAVYVLFTFIQFTYLFGSGDTLLPSGTTYAEHARSGFGELVIVTMINFTILLTVIHKVQRENSFIHRLNQLMLNVLISSTLVMLCSSYIRLIGYEQAYGYTYTRILVHAFLIFLFVLFILALYRIWSEHTSLLKQYLVVAMIAYIGINYMNIDRMIAALNIERYEQTGKIDLHYLGDLSLDVVPELIKLSKKESIGGKDSRLVESLNNELQKIKEDLNDDQVWQSFNISKYRAQKSLEGVE